MTSQSQRFRYADNREDSHLRAQSARELRRETLPPERILWSRLRNRQVEDLKFRRQYPIGPFIVDFFCEELRLTIEVDGRVHDNQVNYDQSRDEYLAGQGVVVKRFSASDVTSRTDGVIKTIRAMAARMRMEKESLKSQENMEPSPYPLPRERGQATRFELEQGENP